MHGYIDYVLVAVFALAPTVLGFRGTPELMSYVCAAALLIVSLLTAYPLGLLKVVPFAIHGSIEVVVVPALVAGPWLLGFDGVPIARNFFVIAAVLLAAVVVLTNYKPAGRRMSSQRAHLMT